MKNQSTQLKFLIHYNEAGTYKEKESLLNGVIFDYNVKCEKTL